MRIGFVSQIDEAMFRFAKRSGFDGVEAGIGRWGNIEPTAENAKKTKEQLDACGIEALTVQFMEDYTTFPDPAKRFESYVAFTKAVGASIISGNAWVPVELDYASKVKYYKEQWGRFAAIAEGNGVRVAIENCPHGGRNFGHCPANFRAMFDAVPSKAIGLEFDPSHYVFQFMDYVASIREFGDRIYAFHAKDTQIFLDNLEAHGSFAAEYSNGAHAFWRFRMPGYGEVDWRKVFVALSDIQYAGDIIIEHEDPTFQGEEGLTKGIRFLRPYMF